MVKTLSRVQFRKRAAIGVATIISTVTAGLILTSLRPGSPLLSTSTVVTVMHGPNDLGSDQYEWHQNDRMLIFRTANGVTRIFQRKTDSSIESPLNDITELINAPDVSAGDISVSPDGNWVMIDSLPRPMMCSIDGKSKHFGMHGWFPVWLGQGHTYCDIREVGGHIDTGDGGVHEAGTAAVCGKLNLTTFAAIYNTKFAFRAPGVHFDRIIAPQRQGSYEYEYVKCTANFVFIFDDRPTADGNPVFDGPNSIHVSTTTASVNTTVKRDYSIGFEPGSIVHSVDYSPDGKRVALFVSRPVRKVPALLRRLFHPNASGNRDELVVANLDGSNQRVIGYVSIADASNADLYPGYVKWAPDMTRLCYIYRGELMCVRSGLND